LSKIEVAPLPFVLLGIAWWRRGRVDWKDVRLAIPFFAVTFVLGLVSVWFQTHVAIGHDVVRTDNFGSRLAGTGWAVWFYLGKTLLPVNVIPIYPRWQIDPTQLLSYLPGLLLCAVFLVFWQYRRTWGKAVLFGLGYAVLMFLPVLGFLNIYFFRFSLVANHWQYFSIIGPVALVMAGFSLAAGFLEKQGAFFKPLLDGSLLAALGVLTWQQASVYRNAETLWRTTSVENPGSFLAHDNLGFIFLQRGDVDAALDQIQTAVQLQPDDAAAQKNLGSALMRQGQVDEAIKQFQHVLAIQPGSAEAHNDLADAFSKIGREAEAIQHWEQAVASQPQYIPALNNLAWALATSPDASLRNGPKALQLARQASELSAGKNLMVLRTLAAACAEDGQFNTATIVAGRALQQAAIQRNLPLMQSLEAQSKLYEAGRPFHTTAN
jgi:tetratricopeptide (TPR) repeat protein